MNLRRKAEVDRFERCVGFWKSLTKHLLGLAQPLVSVRVGRIDGTRLEGTGHHRRRAVGPLSVSHHRNLRPEDADAPLGREGSAGGLPAGG